MLQSDKSILEDDESCFICYIFVSWHVVYSDQKVKASEIPSVA